MYDSTIESDSAANGTRNQAGTEAKTGTTTVALAGTEGVVMAADRRASAGGAFVLNKDTRKIEQVHPTGALAMAGVVGGLQEFVRTLRAEVSLYESRRGERMSMDALATLAGNLLRGGPYVSQPTIAGVGDEPRVFDLDAAGGVLEDEFVAKGSGMQLALGLLEDEYERGDVDDLRGLAARAVETATERDAASGNGVTLATVLPEGVEFETIDESGEVA